MSTYRGGGSEGVLQPHRVGSMRASILGERADMVWKNLARKEPQAGGRNFGRPLSLVELVVDRRAAVAGLYGYVARIPSNFMNNTSRPHQ